MLLNVTKKHNYKKIPKETDTANISSEQRFEKAILTYVYIEYFIY